MAKKGQRIYIKLVCVEEGGRKHTYYSTKNRINSTESLKLKKFNPYLKRPANYEERKMK